MAIPRPRFLLGGLLVATACIGSPPAVSTGTGVDAGDASSSHADAAPHADAGKPSDATKPSEAGKSNDAGHEAAPAKEAGPSCPSPQVLCSRDGGGTDCVTFDTDPANCGACGVTCALGSMCAGGQCALSLVSHDLPGIDGGSARCDLASSWSGRKVGADAAGNLYVLFKCDTTGPSKQLAYTVVIPPGGPAGPAVELPFATGVYELAITGGAAGTAYAVAQNLIAGTQYELSLSITANAGKSWSTPITVSTMTTGNGFSIAVDASDVYISANEAPTGGTVDMVHVLPIGSAPGTVGTDAPFKLSPNAATGSVTERNDVMVDEANDVLLFAGDAPGSGGGGTYVPEEATNAGRMGNGTQSAFDLIAPIHVATGTSLFNSDWAFGGGKLFGVDGVEGSLYALPYGGGGWALASPTVINVLPPTGAEHAVSADAVGNVYVVTETIAGAISLEHIVPGGTTVDSVRILVGSGGAHPAVVAMESGVASDAGVSANKVGVAFGVNGAIYAGVQTY